MAHEDAAPDSAPEDRAPTEAEAARPAGPGRITRVVLKNYKSIVSCDVRLEPLTILVGPNGSGKSNFLDALAFVSEALTLGLEQALRKRGNLERILSVARRPGDDSFAIHLDLEFPSGGTGRYGFKVEQAADGAATVKGESLTLSGRVVPLNRPNLFMEAPDEDDALTRIRDKFFLARHSDAPQIRSAYDLLTSMVFYNPQPDAMRAPVEHDVAPRLHSEGVNAASILRRIQVVDPDHLCGVLAYMQRVLPGLESVAAEDLRGFDALFFRLRVGDRVEPTEFAASQMSDGTLRALAVLIALFQGRLGGKSVPSLVGIEEPENNIHPAAARILLAAMRSAAYDTQVIVTTHSADMLHMGDPDPGSVLVVSAEDGVTTIGPIDAVSQGIVRDNIYTVGELLQMDQLRPEQPSKSANGEATHKQPVPGRS